MTIEKQVTNLEISKRLKELGVKQESIFSWYMYTSGDLNDGVAESYKIMMGTPHKNTSEISAFTVAELGEMVLSPMSGIGNLTCVKNYMGGKDTGWCVGYTSTVNDESKIPRICAQTEAVARGEMLIYLLENAFKIWHANTRRK
jgi:hypothetical protein